MNAVPPWDREAWLAEARIAIGDSYVVTDDLVPFTRDWRGKFEGRAEAVLRPGSTAEVQALVRLCARYGVSIVPQGGNTSVCGASVPTGAERQAVFSLSRMNRIRELDVGNATVTVDAGCILQSIQEHVAAQQFLFPLSLGAQGSCQIGGNIATNAGGIQVLRYGNTRDLVLGLEVVLPDGEVLNLLRGLRKDNTGYDLKQLFIGSEGTLGIVTAATLKLYPAPAANAIAFAGLSSLENAVALLHALRRDLGDRFTAFEVISDEVYALTRHYFSETPVPLADRWPWYVLMEATDRGSDEALASLLELALGNALEAGLAGDVAITRSLAQGEALWLMRENLSHAQQMDGNNIKHDISVPVSGIAAFVRDTVPVVATEYPGVRPFVFGHLGDGNLHFNFSAPAGVSVADWQQETAKVNTIVHREVVRRGGSISAEHGIGQLKRDEMAAFKTPAELAIMQAIKAAIDPDGIMNPGKVLQGRNPDRRSPPA